MNQVILETLGIEIPYVGIAEMHCQALHMKLEIFTNETDWKKSDPKVQRSLHIMINIIEGRFMDQILKEWNLDMYDHCKDKNIYVEKKRNSQNMTNFWKLIVRDNHKESYK